MEEPEALMRQREILGDKSLTITIYKEPLRLKRKSFYTKVEVCRKGDYSPIHFALYQGAFNRDERKELIGQFKDNPESFNNREHDKEN